MRDLESRLPLDEEENSRNLAVIFYLIYVPSWSAGCRTGNGEKLSSSQASPGEDVNSGVAKCFSIYQATSCAPTQVIDEINDES